MTSPFIKTLSDSQPAIILTTALAYVCSDDRWPVAVVVFALLQLAVTLLTLCKARLHHRHRFMRFVARAQAAPSFSSPQAATVVIRRPHLHLVP